MTSTTDASTETAVGTSSPLLLRGGTILTMDAEANVLRDADILVEGGRIAEIGRVATVAENVRILNVSDCLVLPGLIQGHTHLGQTVFRGLAEQRRLLLWLRERIWPLEAAHDNESAYWCSLLGAAECLLGGTTTIQDIGIGPGARGLLEAIRESGLRALAGKCLMDTGDGLPPRLREETEEALASTEALGSEFDGADGGRIRYVVNPRFILTCSDALWRGIREMAERRGWRVHTHALEQQEETEAVRHLKGGRDEIEYFDDQGILGTELSIAHGVCLTPEHLERLNGDRFGVVHCPSSNLKLGSGITDLVRIRQAGLPVSVGADAAVCNNRLDAFEELRLTALLQLMRDPTSFSGLDALRLGTSEGARVLGLDGLVGRIEVGLAADLAVLGTDGPEFVASETVDPHDLVTFSASRACVRHVLVGGEILVEDGQLTRLDLEEIRRRAQQTLKQLLTRAELP